MKTARETAHEIVCERQDSEWCHWLSNKDTHAHYCDTLTAAIEARDAEHLERARAMVERMAENSGRALKNARSAALEEAAKVADERCNERVCHQDAGACIRALSTTPAPEGGR